MNAKRLLGELENGAKITSQWKSRSFQLARREVFITRKDGTVEHFQESALKPIVKWGKVICETWSGGRYIYRLKVDEHV